MTKIGILNFIMDALFAAFLLVALPWIDNTFQMRLFVSYVLMQIIVGRYKHIVLLATDELKLCIQSHIYSFIVCVLIIWSYTPQDWKMVLVFSLLCFLFDVWFAIFSRHHFCYFFKHRVMVIGVGPSAERFRATVAHNRFSMFDIRAFINCNNVANFENIQQRERVDSKRIYPYKQLEEVLIQEKIDTVVIAITQMNQRDIQQIMNKVQDAAENVYFVPRLENLITFDTKVEDYDGQLLIANSSGSIDPTSMFVKRLLDIFFGFLGCLLLIPLSIYVKIVNLKNGDHDPLFFCQKRIGLDGKEFKIYKYRTMVPNADKILEDLMKKDPKIREEYTVNKKLEHDPRVTKAGEFLRKKSLDEFPQFINVLKGDMSLVGPRPYLPREKEDMGENYKFIIQNKPGLTGMWQTHGRSEVDFNERLLLDNYYSHNWNIWLDVVIIYRTISIVLGGKGAM